MHHPIRPIYVCAAVIIEARAIARELGIDFAPPADASPPAQMLVHEQGNLRLALLGIRACHRASLFEAWNHEPPGLIIVAGLAGALDPSLRTGDVVIDGPEDLTSTLPPLPARFGPIATTRDIVPTPAQKAALFAQTRCLAVDMEAEVIRTWARQHAVDFIVVRAISDRADEVLHPAIAAMVDVNGRARFSRLLSTLIRRPWLLPNLIRIGIASHRACARLKSVVGSVVRWRQSVAKHETPRP